MEDKERAELLQEFMKLKQRWRYDPAYPARPARAIHERMEAIAKLLEPENPWILTK